MDQMPGRLQEDWGGTGKDMGLALLRIYFNRVSYSHEDPGM